MKIIRITILIIVLALSVCLSSLSAAEIDERLGGYIVLQVEQNGEAWYVHPDTLARYYLGRPQEAWQIMREQGIGISNANLQKIPIGFVPQKGLDSDADGLGDDLEKSLGTSIFLSDTDQDNFNDKDEISRGFNPLGSGNIPLDLKFTAKQVGKIFLQVEGNGEAWYVYPQDQKRYYLGRPEDAFSIMRAFGQGISNDDIGEINSYSPIYNSSSLEAKMFDLVNDEREQAGFSRLKWNDQLAFGARAHSEDLADENEKFTAIGRTCDFPIIHHEGSEFGLYNSDRLNSRSIHYYTRTGENIALVSSAYYTVTYRPGFGIEEKLENCDNLRHKQEQGFLSTMDKAETEAEKISVLKKEINDREKAYLQGSVVEIDNLNWRDEDKVAQDTVKGWMDSPGHRANILTSEYDESGLGVAKVNGYVISSQTFIERAECGYQGGTCCQDEGYYPWCYSPLSCNNNICQ